MRRRLVLASLGWLIYIVGHVQGYDKGSKDGRVRGLSEAQNIAKTLANRFPVYR